MEKKVHLHQFRLKLSRGEAALFLSAVLLALLTQPIATEDITLSTYYPAPAGAYNNMVTIGNTWLARDPQAGGTPSFVEIGSNQATSGVKVNIFAQDNGTLDSIRIHGSAASPSKYGVVNVSDSGQYERLGYFNGSGMANLFLDGKVGLGTSNPQATLDVEPTMTTCCGSYGCNPCANPILRINSPQNSVTPGNVWMATDQYGDGAWGSGSAEKLGGVESDAPCSNSCKPLPPCPAETPYLITSYCINRWQSGCNGNWEWDNRGICSNINVGYVPGNHNP